MSEIAAGLRQKFALAGNATLTLEGLRTRFTYKIEKTKDDRRTLFWVYVMNGSDNEKDYRFLGGVYAEGTDFGTAYGFYVSSRSPIGKSSLSARAFSWFIKHPEDPRMHVFHAGTCGKCGRKLTTPESIRTGLGPVCAGRKDV